MENIHSPNLSSPMRIFKDLLVVFLLLFAFLVLGVGLAQLIMQPFYPIDEQNIALIMSGSGPDSLRFPIMFLQGITATLTFLVLPILYIIFIKKWRSPFFDFNFNQFGMFLFFGILVFFVALPVIGKIAELNQNIVFPSGLESMDTWMRAKETQMQTLVKFITGGEGTLFFTFAMVVIALIPAISEEVFFRGWMQEEFKLSFKNVHIAIWLTGFIFSLIHFQFLGFFPRMFLGVLFGYLYYWSGNLLVPIVLHFINNGATLMALLLYKKGMIETDPETTTVPWAPVLLCLGLSVFLLYKYHHTAKERLGRIERLRDWKN